jgi:cytochrome d ubiquinol oxidase subunit I
MALVALWSGWVALRRREIATNRTLLKAILVASPLGLLAIEAGWTVTEVGRQPWIIYGVMRTSEAVTPMPGLVLPFTTITLLYLMLGVIVVRLLRRHVAAAHAAGVA